MSHSLRNNIEKFVSLTDADWNLLVSYLETRILKKSGSNLINIKTK